MNIFITTISEGLLDKEYRAGVKHHNYNVREHDYIHTENFYQSKDIIENVHDEEYEHYYNEDVFDVFDTWSSDKDDQCSEIQVFSQNSDIDDIQYFLEYYSSMKDYCVTNNYILTF